MSYSYEFSREVVFSFRDYCPRGCINLSILTGLSQGDISLLLIRSFRYNQLAWKTYKKLIKELEDYDSKYLYRLSPEDQTAFFDRFKWIQQDFVLDSYEST